MKEETLVLHAGHRRDETTTSVAVPIYQTTSYQFDNTEHASKLFSLQELGNIYTRIMNPTCAVLEERMAKLDGGVAAMAVSSGQAASAFSIQNICHSGDNFVMAEHGIYFLILSKKLGLNADSLIRQNLNNLRMQLMKKPNVFMLKLFQTQNLMFFQLTKYPK